MLIKTIDVYVVNLPFNFSFGHSLAKRHFSQNIIVKVQLEDGSIGYGEGIPREYVTGETVDSVLKRIEDILVPQVLRNGVSMPSAHDLGQGFANDQFMLILEEFAANLNLTNVGGGAAWCALELAILDAYARSQKKPLAEIIGTRLRTEIRYDGVVPFARKKYFLGLLCFYKLYGFETVKLKLGTDDEENLYKVKTARAVLGDGVKLRVDVNGVWNLNQALRSSEAFRSFGVLSYEQPFAANSFSDLQKLTASIPEEVVLDESLRTVAEAESLASQRIGSGFNIRLSKVGGIIAAQEIVEIAKKYKINCHLGAQVGESAILSSAGRIFACTQAPFANYEGSANGFLLKKDLAREDLTVSLGGKGKLGNKSGLGITVLESRLKRLMVAHKTYALSATLDKALASVDDVVSGKDVVGVR